MKKIGFMLFACLWILVGGLFTRQYVKHGYITLKGGTLIHGTQAIIFSVSLIIFGIIFALVSLRAPHTDKKQY